MKRVWATIGTVAGVLIAALISFQIWFFNAVFNGMTDLRMVTRTLDRELVVAQRERVDIVTDLQRHKLGLNGHGE